MEEHARNLAQGLQRAQRGTLRGRIDAPVGRGVRRGRPDVEDEDDENLRIRRFALHDEDGEDGDGRRRAGHSLEDEEDEEIYALKRAVTQARARVKRTRTEITRSMGKNSSGQSDQDEDEDIQASQIRGENELRELRKILVINNTRSFLNTIQHEDVRDASTTFYRMEGLDKNVPIPIAPESETPLCLREMTTALAKLTGVRILSLDRVQLPDLRRTSWTIRGEAASAEAEKNTTGDDALESKNSPQQNSTFKATFLVHEREQKVSDLNLDVSDEVALEIAPALVHCREKACFRTFFSVFADYGRFHTERDRLFNMLTDKFPHACKTVVSWSLTNFDDPAILDGVSKILRIRLRGRGQAFLVWAPVFRPSDAGRCLETRAHLLRLLSRSRSNNSQNAATNLSVDHGFENLATHLGLHKAALEFISATCATEPA